MKQYFIGPLFALSIGLFGAVSSFIIPESRTTPASTVAPLARTVEITSPTTTSTTSTTTTIVLTPEQIEYLRQLEVEKARKTWGKCGEWHDLAISVGWSEDEWVNLQQVIFRESRCQADAWNGADAGLMQINRIHTKFINEMGLGTFPDGMFLPENNLRFGLKLWEGSCWKPWRFSGTTFGCDNR